MKALNSQIGSRFSGVPIVSWSGRVQPVPLHRSRVVFAGRGGRIGSYLPDSDQQFRRDLRQLWHLSKLREPLEGDLGVVMRFRGSSTDPINPRTRWNRPDLSNLVKAVEDAGNPDPKSGWAGLWGDDRQVLALIAEIEAWGPRLSDPLVALDIWRLA